MSATARERLFDFALSDSSAFFRNALTTEAVDIADNLQLELAHRAR